MGQVHLYIGDGKGKTTAAMGLALRAYGSGLSVIVAQFLKQDDSGEIQALRQLQGVQILHSGCCDRFTFQMNDAERADTLDKNNRLLQLIIAQLHDTCLVVLDELLDAIDQQLVSPDLVQILLQSAGELVLTGRNPSTAILQRADYVTEMKKIKHPYDHGQLARKGIEY